MTSNAFYFVIDVSDFLLRVTPKLVLSNFAHRPKRPHLSTVSFLKSDLFALAFPTQLMLLWSYSCLLVISPVSV
jgi:hypothetical protein